MMLFDLLSNSKCNIYALYSRKYPFSTIQRQLRVASKKTVQSKLALKYLC